jgi:hypothetical protein
VQVDGSRAHQSILTSVPDGKVMLRRMIPATSARISYE